MPGDGRTPGGRYSRVGRYRPLWQRFWERVDMTGGEDACWPWLGRSRSPTGYARCWDGQRTRQAHQLAYELGIGPIPPGMEIDHTCKRRDCQNPAHLEAATHGENLRRSDVHAIAGRASGAAKSARTHCPHGHEFTPENTRTRRGGARRCLTCHRSEAKRAYRNRRATA